MHIQVLLRAAPKALACVLVVLASLSFAFAREAQASTFLARVSIPSSGSNCAGSFLGDFATDRVIGSGSSGFSDTTATAAAGPGSLSGKMDASATGTSSNFTFAASACFRAELTIDDIVIEGPGSQVATTLSVDVSGALSGSNSPGSRGLGSTTASVTAPGGGSAVFSSGVVSFGFSGDPLAGIVPFGGTLTTSSFNAPVGQAFSVEMTLAGQGTVTARRDSVGQQDGTAVFENDFGSTLSFTRLGPVFDLPQGYTVHSVDGSIIDNQYVPESASGVLFVSGLLLFAARRPVH